MNQLTTTDIRDGAPGAGLLGSRLDLPGVAEPSFTEALVDPRGVFRDPAEVVAHRLFSPEEKRAVLLSWARDEIVLEQVANGALPELRPKSRIDAVIEALAHVDPLAASEYSAAVARIRGALPGSVLWMRAPRHPGERTGSRPCRIPPPRPQQAHGRKPSLPAMSHVGALARRNSPEE